MVGPLFVGCGWRWAGRGRDRSAAGARVLAVIAGVGSLVLGILLFMLFILGILAYALGLA